MLYPTIQQITAEKHVNRYAIVIATAKGARYITDKANREREEAKLQRETDRLAKDIKCEGVIGADSRKPVSEAVEKLEDNEFKIIMPKENTED